MKILDSNSRFAVATFRVDGIGKVGSATISIDNPGSTEVCIPVSMTLRSGREVKASFFLTIEEAGEDAFGFTWRLVSDAEGV
jgi:hypothetical protein